MQLSKVRYVLLAEHRNAMPHGSFQSISDVAAKYGVTLRALRLYEEKGLITPLRIGSRRYYDVRSCRRLELVLQGKRLGFSLYEIWKLVSIELKHDEPKNGISSILSKDLIVRKLTELREKQTTVTAAIDHLKMSLDRLS